MLPESMNVLSYLYVTTCDGRNQRMDSVLMLSWDCRPKLLLCPEMSLLAGGWGGVGGEVIQDPA